MTDKVTKRRIIFATVFSVAYLLLTIFYHHNDKYLTGIIFIILTLLIPISFISIVIYDIIGVIQMLRNIRNLTTKLCLPTIVCSLTLLYTIFSPYRLDSENLESKIKFRACYEDTQNRAIIKFREDRTFELNWTGAFFANTWWTGKWNKNGDTIILKYDNKVVKQLGDKVLIDKDYLRPIGNSGDTSMICRPMFYLGFCRHEN